MTLTFWQKIDNDHQISYHYHHYSEYFVQVKKVEVPYVSVEKEMDAIESTNLPGEKKNFLLSIRLIMKTGIKVGNSTKRTRIIVEKASHDHSYCVPSPRRLRRKIDDIVAKAEKVKKKLKISQQKACRWRVRVSTLRARLRKISDH